MQLRGFHDCQVHQHNNPNSKVDDGTSEVGEAGFDAGRSMTQGAQLGSVLPAGGAHLHLQTPLHHSRPRHSCYRGTVFEAEEFLVVTCEAPLCNSLPLSTTFVTLHRADIAFPAQIVKRLALLLLDRLLSI